MNSFWSRGKIVDACLEWTGATLPRGYGYFYAHGRMYYAHRHAWTLANGSSVPPKKNVCHACDNPKCFLPSHLFIGTQTENMRDAKRKGRLSVGKKHGDATRPELRPIGEMNGYSKLTDDDVREIRRMVDGGIFQILVGRKFGISQANVSRIARRKTWAHVL